MEESLGGVEYYLGIIETGVDEDMDQDMMMGYSSAILNSGIILDLKK